MAFLVEINYDASGPWNMETHLLKCITRIHNPDLSLFPPTLSCNLKEYSTKKRNLQHSLTAADQDHSTHTSPDSEIHQKQF